MNSLYLLQQYENFIYPLAFLLMFLEGGDGTLFASGFLIRLGYLKFWIIFPVTICGIFIRDLILYNVGQQYGEKFIEKYGKIFCITPQRFQAIKKRLKNSKGKTIFASKFIYGLNHITILAVGAAKIDFKKFFKLGLIAIVIWELIMIGLGFFLGHSFALLKKYIKDIGIFLLAIYIIFIAFEFLIRQKIKINGQENIRNN